MFNTDPFLSPDGRFWIDPLDGRTVPVVRGGDGPEHDGTEGSAGVPAGVPDPPESGAGGAAVPIEATQSEAGAHAHGFASVDDAVAELTKVRSEAANRRVKLKPYEEAFEGFDEEARTTYLELAKQIASGDAAQQKAAAKRFREIAERIDGATVPVTPTGEEDPEQKPLTVKEWKALQAQQDDDRHLQEQVRLIEADATKEGIEVGSARYATYLYALQQPDVAGDHEKAMAVLNADRQAIIDQYAKAVAEGQEKWPVAPGSAALGAPGEEVKPLNWKDARKAAAALISGRAGAATG